MISVFETESSEQSLDSLATPSTFHLQPSNFGSREVGLTFSCCKIQELRLSEKKKTVEDDCGRRETNLSESGQWTTGPGR
jgi:hypothetical protein